MRFSAIHLSLTALLLVTIAACTQSPAQVDMRGQNSYGRSGANSYSSNAYTSTATTQSAAVQSIGVSDLSSPASKTHVADVTPFQRAHPETLSPAAGGSQSFNIRPQASSTAATKPQMVSDVKKSSDTAVAKLDSVIDNDGSVGTATAAITKQVKLKTADSGFMWPVASKKVISEFGPKGKGKANDGINIASADGEPVWAAADGEVVYVGNELQGYGNMVLIKHTGDKATTYAHLSKATVDKYDHVKQGDIIGYVGTTGNVKEPQLHFAIRDGKDAVNPLKYLDRKVASLH